MYKSNIFLQNFSPFTGWVLTVFYACDIITLIENEKIFLALFGAIKIFGFRYIRKSRIRTIQTVRIKESCVGWELNACISA